ncbi:DNA-binding transcriptional LysR family regulator [Microbacterium terrae]|uniref:HTH-type transcriptional activator AllS n=1 Tax=Microbacterium terrae TaxID=69369 RepID=A0A0M2GWP7_9MICO|nr:LysR family transcriptional regulator [Microbacterium terrae]KJL38333.1 HTH-type transcriptional activator AllS [Microbacterium terrae]MBP1079026.1 DNA-binding transcriptional LysR family regulator [Microbacterium terrae]GLJ98426.1 hydrogen peroxide-inducible protein [Microbacterium terrae]
MPDLDLLRTFIAVHRTGSISAAAASLGVSQPSVSERIARLEAAIGEPLLVRSARGAAPTPAGDRLAAQTADAVDRLSAVWSQPRATVPSVVRIGGASDVVASRVIPALAELAADGPDGAGGLRLEFTLGLAPDLLAALADGDLDIVVSSVRTPLRGIRYRGLVDEEFVLVGSPALARTIDRRRAAEDTARALVHLPLVAYDTDLSIVRRYWRSQFGDRPANPVAMVVPDLRGILAAVVAGVGISALPRYLADPAVAAGTVEVLHRPDEAPINTLHLAIAAGDAPTGVVGRVIDALVERARGWDVF